MRKNSGILMKRNMLWPLNKGFSLIEVLISIIIIGLVSFGLICLNNYRLLREIKIEKELKEELFIDNLIDIFNNDPTNFKTNYTTIYHQNWENNSVINNDYPTLKISCYYETNSLILIITRNNEVIEQWRRYPY